MCIRDRDRALQIVIRDSPELTSNIVCELVGEIVHLDDDDYVPQRVVDYTNDGVGVRVGFLCASTAQQDCIAVTLKKSLERRAVELKLFPADNKPLPSWKRLNPSGATSSPTTLTASEDS